MSNKSGLNIVNRISCERLGLKDALFNELPVDLKKEIGIKISDEFMGAMNYARVPDNDDKLREGHGA